MHTIFFDENGRLRSGWRAAIFLLAFGLAAMLLGTVAKIMLGSFGIDAAPGSAAFLIVNGSLSLIAAILLGWLAGRVFENLPYRALGAAFTRGWMKHLVIGLALGAATLSLVLVIAAVFGGLRFQLNSDAGTAIAYSLASSFVVFAIAAAFEEALFRGYILQTFARSGLAWLAILLTSVLFGAVHLGNPNSNYIATVNTVLAGIWFSIAYLKTRDLWFVWGLHLMWNWMQGSIFGVEVSGVTQVSWAPVLREIDAGPAWLTGESYGIEAGIASTIALIVSIGVIYYLPGLKPDDEVLALNSVPPSRPEA